MPSRFVEDLALTFGAKCVKVSVPRFEIGFWFYGFVSEIIGLSSGMLFD